MGKKPLAFMSVKWVFILISLVCVGLSVHQIWVKGLNFGVDFLGGSKMIYAFKSDVTPKQIRAVTDQLNLGDIQVVSFGEGSDENSDKIQYMIRAKYSEEVNVAAAVEDALIKTFGEENIDKLSQEVVGPKVGEDLKQDGLNSIIGICLALLVYIWWRFDFMFSPGAIMALAHDVLISVGFFAYSGREFNLPILAALLTILGYSINDTIVIYDRIRENLQRLPKSVSLVDVINVSLTETLRRTIVTSLTLLLVVLVLFFYGGGVLHDFAFCLIVGTVFGTYSSIFIASPIYLAIQKFFPKKSLKVSETRPAKAA